MSEITTLLPEEVQGKFEAYNYNHAFELLTQTFPNEWTEVLNCLKGIEITVEDARKRGGNESPIPPKFGSFLEPLGWKEIKITGDLTIKFYPRKGKKKSNFAESPNAQKVILDFIDGHNIDYVKDRVALDVEWNSKDQTFDRDLFAMRTYYECGIISAGIIITRSEELNDIFKVVLDDKGEKLIKKYGASTTWIGQLLRRLESRRHGGCPILALAIKKPCIIDWRETSNDGYESDDA